MSSNKLLLKDRVLTCGAGSRRVVLDYALGIVYQYDEPSNVLASFEQGKGWIVLKRPYYRQAGWGNSSGDAEGATRIDNARSLLNSINAEILELNAYSFMTQQEFTAMNKAIEAQNKVIDTQNKVLKNGTMERVDKLEPLKLKRDERNGRKGNKGSDLKGIDAISIAERYKTATQVFVQGKGKAVKVDTYRIERDLVTQQIALQAPRIVAFRDSQGQVFMNSQVLDLSGFERSFMGGQSIIQSQIRKIAKFSIPFNVLESANLKLNETRVLEQGPEATYQIKRNSYDSKTEERHFTGALLLENNGRKFLMDIDRVEIQHGLFNAFFVELDASVTSILDAYESMKPAQVKLAENNGLEVKRQGEWFFVATGKTIVIDSETQEFDGQWYLDRAEVKPTQYVLKQAVAHGKGRPNNLFKPFGFDSLDELVCGVVSHQGREHKDLDLGRKVLESDKDGREVKVELTLWRLVPNTTVSNFTVSGEID